MEVSCNECGRTYTASRSDSRYCSNKCRTAAHRQRTNPDQRNRPRTPLRQQSSRAGLDLHRLAARVERILDDDRLSRNREVVGNDMRAALDYMQRVIDRARAEVGPGRT